MNNLETFKIANDTITLDDECRVVSCSRPDFIESALKEIKDCGDDLYYIDYINFFGLKIITYLFILTCPFRLFNIYKLIY